MVQESGMACFNRYAVESRTVTTFSTPQDQEEYS
jgi:hypothetical protein